MIVIGRTEREEKRLEVTVALSGLHRAAVGNEASQEEDERTKLINSQFVRVGVSHC